MKRGCFCDIVNVNKEKQRRNYTTLRDPARYLFVWRFEFPLFLCTAFYCAENLRIVYEKRLWYQWQSLSSKISWSQQSNAFDRYVKLSVYKHDNDQSDTTHSSVYSASRQDLCWDYFAFIWTQLVEVVICQAWYAETIGWDLGVYG